MGLKGAQKERSSKPMGSMWCRKVRMGHSKPEVMQAKKVKGDGKPMSPKDEG